MKAAYFETKQYMNGWLGWREGYVMSTDWVVLIYNVVGVAYDVWNEEVLCHPGGRSQFGTSRQTGIFNATLFLQHAV